MKKLKEKMLVLGLNPKKEFTIVLLLDLILILASVLLFIFLKEIIYLVICVGLAFIFDLVFLSRYSKQINDKNSRNLQEFAVIFGYFKIFIHNGYSVYSALKELISFANPDLKKMIKELIGDIDNDKSVQPFVKFAKQFNEIIVEEMMISIFQMIDDGASSDYLTQFDLIFDKFSDLLYQKFLQKKNSKLGTIASTALIGSSFLVVVLTIGIISIIGEVINGI